MRKIMKRSIALVLAVLMAVMVVSGTGIMGNNKAQAAGNKPKYETSDACFKTTMSSLGRYVTVSVSLNNKTNLTSGQVVVYYDPNVMELDWALNYGLLGLEDVNLDYGNDELGAVAFAFSSENELTRSDKAITLCFKVKKAVNKQKVTVLTDVTEAYNKDGQLANAEEMTQTSTTLRVSMLESWFGGKGQSIFDDFNRVWSLIRARLWW